VQFPRQIPDIPPHGAHYELRTDVVYDEVGGVPLRFDHYRPLGCDAPVPAVVFLHGGGWAFGDPSQAAGNGPLFAARGLATISLSYRLAQEAPFPAAVLDARRGLRWVRANATALGIDPERLVLLGLSAGAHLAMLVHLTAGIDVLEAELPNALRPISERVLGVIGHYGPYDLARRRRVEDWDPIGAFLGARADDPEWIRLASPVAHARRAEAPILLIHGTADTVVSHRESVRMHAALEAAGKPSELLLLDGAPHAFQMDWSGDANRRANATMDRFLDGVLGTTG
jgi:acetyl esterase/lipase